MKCLLYKRTHFLIIEIQIYILYFVYCVFFTIRTGSVLNYDLFLACIQLKSTMKPSNYLKWEYNNRSTTITSCLKIQETVWHVEESASGGLKRNYAVCCGGNRLYTVCVLTVMVNSSMWYMAKKWIPPIGHRYLKDVHGQIFQYAAWATSNSCYWRETKIRWVLELIPNSKVWKKIWQNIFNFILFKYFLSGIFIKHANYIAWK